MEERWLSLAEAARRAGMSEEALRREVLLGQVPATPVPDDRHYLVREDHLPGCKPAPGPCRKIEATLSAPCRGKILVRGVLGAALVLFLVCGTSQGSYLCTNCTAIERRVKVGGLPVFRATSQGRYASLVVRAYPGPCDHAWARMGPPST